MAKNNNPVDKKMLENPFVGSLVVPIAIVLVGALVIFGVTKMLSTDQSYKDLVREMQSKQFGNKWVSALELSKLIASNKIPEEDIPWLVENLSHVYKNTVDSRTRDFVVVALGALRNPLALELLQTAVKDTDKNVQFHAVVALGNIPQGVTVDWTDVLNFLEAEDHGIKQAAILALGTHRVAKAESKLQGLLSDDGRGVRFAAGTSLIYFKNESALPVIKEILSLEFTPSQDKNKSPLFSVEQIAALKLNILNAVSKSDWKAPLDLIQEISTNDKDVKVVSKAKEVLKQLKK